MHKDCFFFLDAWAYRQKWRIGSVSDKKAVRGMPFSMKNEKIC